METMKLGMLEIDRNRGDIGSYLSLSSVFVSAAASTTPDRKSVV